MVKPEGSEVDIHAPTVTADESPVAPVAPHSNHPVAPLQFRDPRRYEMLGEHGRGGLGHVSRAHDRELGRTVAIKGLIKHDDVGEIRFLREALITARLEHPGIVPIHEAGRWPDGTPFYVMKLVAGRPLKDLIAERHTVEVRLELLHHVIAVADAMAYAHRVKIIHRDLKPGNVIAGDFGETIVIDWGLAKDLTVASEHPVADGPYRTAPQDDLTAAGSVLGTPMYMAPEQALGGQVDQRADVFAIGAMLWELCSLHRVPPPETRARRRELRKSRIDKDLAAIVCKALEARPEDRYRDAGELAKDLKAFKAGARIAARRYSLVDTLVHWTRRHRAVALTIAIATVLVVVGAILYVRNIAIERDRADAALEISTVQQQRAERANDDLILQNAELLLGRDPTAAAAVLASHHGSDAVRHERLLAEARGRGVARAALTPHTDTVWLLTADPSGAVVSLSEDRQIQRTRGGVSTKIADDVATSGLFTRTPDGHWLGYLASSGEIVIIDLAALKSTRIMSDAPEVMTFSSDASHLAVVEAGDKLRVWRLSAQPAVVHEQHLPGVIDVKFSDPERLVIARIDGLQLVPLGQSIENQLHVSGAISSYDVRGEHIVTGNGSGLVEVRVQSLSSKVAAKAPLCHKRVNDVRFVGPANAVAFACHEGIAGLARYDVATGSLTVMDSFSTSGPAFRVAADRAGQQIAIQDESTTVTTYEIASRLYRRHGGHEGRISAIALPDSLRGQLLTGDVNGAVRIWDLPPSPARVVLQTATPIYGAAFAPDSKTMATYGFDGVVREVALEGGAVSELRGHTEIVSRVQYSADGASLLSFGPDGTVRTWDPQSLLSTRVFRGHGTVVNDAAFVGARVVSVGDDGHLRSWSPYGSDSITLFETSRPLTALAVLGEQRGVAVHDSAGAMWHVTMTGMSVSIRGPARGPIVHIRSSPDGSLLAVADATGTVDVYDSRTWSIVRSVSTRGAVRVIHFDPSNRDLLIASEDSRVRVVALNERVRFSWREVAAPARSVSYSPDGNLIGFVCSDGGGWFYSVNDDRWFHVRDHDTDVLFGRFSRDGKWFASSDRRGRVVVRDMVSMFERE